MDKLTRMQTLLPHLTELPRDGSCAPFWQAAETGNVWAVFTALLPLFSGEHRRCVFGMAAAITGTEVHVLLRQPFPAVCRSLLQSLDEDVLLLCRLVSGCGARAVARVLYQYRPPCAMAIPELILMDRDNLTISLYACDMLRGLVGMLARDAADIPTIREILAPQPTTVGTKEAANRFVDDMIRIFGGKEHQHEQQA